MSVKDSGIQVGDTRKRVVRVFTALLKAGRRLRRRFRLLCRVLSLLPVEVDEVTVQTSGGVFNTSTCVQRVALAAQQRTLTLAVGSVTVRRLAAANDVPALLVVTSLSLTVTQPADAGLPIPRFDVTLESRSVIDLAVDAADVLASLSHNVQAEPTEEPSVASSARIRPVAPVGPGVPSGGAAPAPLSALPVSLRGGVTLAGVRLRLASRGGATLLLSLQPTATVDVDVSRGLYAASLALERVGVVASGVGHSGAVVRDATLLDMGVLKVSSCHVACRVYRNVLVVNVLYAWVHAVCNSWH